MKYKSTRGKVSGRTFSEAVTEGLASDGGLFVPESFPNLREKILSWEGLGYPELCFEFLKNFATDIPEVDLKRIVFESYKKFDNPQIAPIKKLDDGIYVLELYHGPTLAFKDFALQLLGNLYEYLLSKSGKKINVLGATSGDTGSAAIAGLLGKNGVNIFILYPEGRISPLQERQMTCTGAKNVFPISIKGTFDDAQNIVKELFSDNDFKNTWNLSAINSINLARILAQCVYYIYAYLKIDKESRKNLEFVVPTGNFGNILAGWIVSKMGLDVTNFRIATNRNDILYRLFKTGVYELGDVSPSYAPSMDIQVASNFERYIYFAEHEDSEKVVEIMNEFKKTGKWSFRNFDKSNFIASRCSDEEIAEEIFKVYKKYNFIIDPHTACGFKDIDESKTSMILSTAHPAKFPELIKRVIGIEPKNPTLEILMNKKISKVVIEPEISIVRDYIEVNGIKA